MSRDFQNRLQTCLVSTSTLFVLILSTAAPATCAELAIEKEFATETGWRGAIWRMSVAELAKIFGRDFQEENRSKKEKDSDVAVRGKLRSKLQLDGLEYEVKFGFTPSDKFNAVFLVCNKPKKESLLQVRERLTELFGATHAQSRSYGRVGFAVHPDVSAILSWRQGQKRIEFHSLEIRPNVFMWVRRLSVIVSAPESEKQFEDKGLYSFTGEVAQSRGKKGARWCLLEVNPSKETLKASCQGEVIFDQKLTEDDRLKLGARGLIGDLDVQDLTVSLKGVPDLFELSIGTDVVSLLQQTFPKQVQ